jgi:hypothetical protein
VKKASCIARGKTSNDAVPFGHRILLAGPAVSHMKVFAGGGAGESGFLQKAGSPALFPLFLSAPSAVSAVSPFRRHTL